MSTLQNFIRVKSIEELCRLLASKSYGTEDPAKGEREAPYLQAFLDRDCRLDIGDRSDVIDVNMRSGRSAVFQSIKRKGKAEFRKQLADEY